MVWLVGGSSFTKRNGNASGTAAFDANPEDVGLAHANGWTVLNQAQWPALLDFPEYGTPNPVGAMNSFKIFQSALPMILAPSGTGSTAGAITLGTALPTNFMNGNCYLNLPANCLGGNANAAGWYYALMTSTTAGTVNNNTYSSGLPFVPGSGVLTPFAGAGSAYTGVTSAQTALSWTLPGNLLGPNGLIEFSLLLGFNASTNNKTVTIKIGASTIFSLVEATTAITAYQAYVVWANQGATNKQIVQPGGITGASSTANTYTAIDTTVSQTITVNLTDATATDWISVDSFSAIVTPG